jgi:chemotaxis protein methyltransferase CheR
MAAIEKLSTDLYHQLRDFIYEQCGIFFSDAKLYFIENRISKRLEALQLKSYRDYLTLLKSPSRRDELSNLFDQITTNETSFYRNPPQFEALRQFIFPRLIEQAKKRNQTLLKIWSAACSSGEEPLTLAMEALEVEHLWRGMQLQIVATDISKEILDKAETGLYSDYSMRNLPDTFKKHFKPCNGHFLVNPRLKSMIRYRLFNLVDYPGYANYRSFDLIFCRNVLIYFDLPVKRNIIAQFYKSLNPNGYMVIGHAESLHNVNQDFKLEHFSRAIGYIRP